MLTHKRDAGVHRHIQRRGSRPGVQPSQQARLPEVTSTTNADLSIEVDRRIRNARCSFRKYTFKLYDRPSASLEPRYSRPCCTAASRDAGVHRHIQRRGSRPGVQPSQQVRLPEVTSTTNDDLSIEVDRRIRNARCSFRKYTFKLYDRPSASLEPRYSRPCCTAASRGARARATTTRCAEPTTGS